MTTTQLLHPDAVASNVWMRIAEEVNQRFPSETLKIEPYSVYRWAEIMNGNKRVGYPHQGGGSAYIECLSELLKSYGVDV